jgi:glycosyltransferase involved in cell wall biosynthesis
MLRISIVTPSFNQASFLQATIESVFAQSHPNVEYIIMDGGSTDNSLEIIKKHAGRLAYWQSEKDSGQANAINQGWKRATGDVLSYLNSDDLLLPNALSTIAEAFEKNPDIHVIYGDAILIDSSGQKIADLFSHPFEPQQVLTTWEDPIVQASAFVRRSVLERFGGFDESFHFCLDFEYWVRIFDQAKLLHIPIRLSAIRLHSASKTSTAEVRQASELLRIAERAISARLPAKYGIQEQKVRNGVHHRAALHYRSAGQKLAALKTYAAYCAHTYSPIQSLYRLTRFTAGMLLKG